MFPLHIYISIYHKEQQPHRGSVAERSVKGFSVGIEKVLYVRETLDLELLRLLLDHLSAQTQHRR